MRKVFFITYVVILASFLFVQFVIGPIINKFAEGYLRDKTTIHYRHLAQGVYFMMERDLLRLPRDKWANRIKELQPQFGYHISLTPYENLTISTPQKKILHDGMIAVIKDGRYLYKQVGDSDMVLGMGAFSNVKLGYLRLYIWLIIMAILIPLTLIWIIPYWRQLRKIGSAAIAFGNGNFDIRADVSKRSSLVPIANAFNTMAEQIQQLINSHKELTNDVSHELRIPISRIRFGLEMLESSNEPQKKEHYLNGLKTDVGELEDLVTELLTFARFNREKPEMIFYVQPLESWLAHLLFKSVPKDGPVKVQLVINVSSPSSQANFDPKYMARALGNLIQNGLCYAKSQLYIIVEQENDNCCIHIDDDGPGILAKDREKIFEPFTRLDSSRDRSTGGYGLGLAIVSKIVDWHNGQIAVGDSPLGGARFTLRWPGFIET